MKHENALSHFRCQKDDLPYIIHQRHIRLIHDSRENENVHIFHQHPIEDRQLPPGVIKPAQAMSPLLTWDRNRVGKLAFQKFFCLTRCKPPSRRNTGIGRQSHIFRKRQVQKIIRLQAFERQCADAAVISISVQQRHFLRKEKRVQIPLVSFRTVATGAYDFTRCKLKASVPVFLRIEKNSCAREFFRRLHLIFRRCCLPPVQQNIRHFRSVFPPGEVSGYPSIGKEHRAVTILERVPADWFDDQDPDAALF